MNIRNKGRVRLRDYYARGPTLAADNYHDQENAQFSYFPMGKIKEEKQILIRRELPGMVEIKTFLELKQLAGSGFIAVKKG